ncbi:MAG: transporter substrate-binding protein [Lachnospiraceae bacterium]|nr:transporter substrate-binding protein [Lachnospiraceae bacterium]
MRWKNLLGVLLATSMVAGSLVGCGSANSALGGGSADAAEKDTIKIGSLEDWTGDYATIGIQKYHAAELAVEELNKNGGLLGKEVELVAYDCQSDTTKYQEFCKKLVQDDQVDVIMGCMSSACREAIRPYIEENNALLFYNNQYEGGVASHNVFCTGTIPEQNCEVLVKELLDQGNTSFYTIAADYNFGQIMTQWVDKTVVENGGVVAGEEFIPLGTSQFESTIQKIKDADPDVLVCELVGTAQASFYEQFLKSGIEDITMASTVQIVQSYDHKTITAPALGNMYVTGGFVEEMADYSDAAKEFVDMWRAKYPEEGGVYMEGEIEYTGIMLWAKAVEKAGTTEVEAVIDALESGEISVESAAGTVTIDGATHHAIKDIFLILCDENHELHVENEIDAVEPYWLRDELKIDLRVESPNKQYTPIDE